MQEKSRQEPTVWSMGFSLFESQILINMFHVHAGNLRLPSQNHASEKGKLFLNVMAVVWLFWCNGNLC